MEKISQTEAARLLGYPQTTINRWCDPERGLVRLEEHPFVSERDFAELKGIVSDLASGKTTNQIRLERAREEGIRAGFAMKVGV